MLDLFHMVTRAHENGDYQVFGPTGANPVVQKLVKPRGAKLMYAVAFGGGGGGGAGATGAAATARGGGGGGGSGGMYVGLFPLALLPDALYVAVAPAAAAGAAGTATYLSLYTANNVLNHLLLAQGGGAGGTGTSTAVGAAGTAATNPTGPLLGAMFGHTQFTSGQAGAAGGAIAGGAGPQITIAAGFRVTGGNGGAGTTSADFAGGFHVATVGAMIPQVRPVGPAAGSNPGGAGFTVGNILGSNSMPLFYFGGQGGSSSNTLPGGRGGDGAPGCGGGGGGGGTTGGAGGSGGPGQVIVLFW